MKAPQIVYICLALFSLLVCALKHGDHKTGKHSFPIDFVSHLLGFLLLVWGGFFGGAK